MCQLGSVSRSGYYAWKAAASLKRLEREEKDKKDFALILSAYEYRGLAKGACAIHMRLLHMSPSVITNVKKIRRLMKKFNLKYPIANQIHIEQWPKTQNKYNSSKYCES